MCKEFVDCRERTRDAAGFDVGQPTLQTSTDLLLENLCGDHLGQRGTARFAPSGGHWFGVAGVNPIEQVLINLLDGVGLQVAADEFANVLARSAISAEAVHPGIQLVAQWLGERELHCGKA